MTPILKLFTILFPILYAISGCNRGFEPDSGHFQFEDIYHFYSKQSEITDPGNYAYLYEDLPEDPIALAKVVQGICIHEAFFSSRGIKPSGKQKGYENHRVEELLRKIHQLNQKPLTKERSSDEKLAVICSNYAALYCSMLRFKGIPCRVRSGYSSYFFPGKYDNHYVCEYWNAAEERWIMTDPQLDSFHMAYFKIDFDPFDIPEDKFINGGQAWFMVRQDGYDPDLFGLGGGGGWEGGMEFLRPGVFSDFITLNKFEVQPWDIHPVWDKPGTLPLSFIDGVARSTLDDIYFEDRILLYESHEVLKLPRNFKR